MISNEGNENVQIEFNDPYKVVNNSYGLLNSYVCFHSYKRSAALSQFVMHRGLIISVMQVCGVGVCRWGGVWCVVCV